jgi:hypothetical protein
VKTTEKTAEFLYDDLLLVLVQWDSNLLLDQPRLITQIRLYLMPRPERDLVSSALFRAASRGVDANLHDRLSATPLKLSEVLYLISEKMHRAMILYCDLMDVWDQYALSLLSEGNYNGKSGATIQVAAVFVGKKIPLKYMLTICFDFHSILYPHGTIMGEIESRMIYDFTDSHLLSKAHSLQEITCFIPPGMNRLQRLLHTVSSFIG